MSDEVNFNEKKKNSECLSIPFAMEMLLYRNNLLPRWFHAKTEMLDNNGCETKFLARFTIAINELGKFHRTYAQIDAKNRLFQIYRTICQMNEWGKL